MSLEYKKLRRNIYKVIGVHHKTGFNLWRFFFEGVNQRTGECRSFFIEYYLINPNYQKNGNISLGNNGNNIPSYMMVKVGFWGKYPRQINNFFSINCLTINKKDFLISTDNFSFSEKMIMGNLLLSLEEMKNKPEFLSDFGSARWEIEISRNLESLVNTTSSSLLSRLFYKLQLHWSMQGKELSYKGNIVVNGEKFDINTKGYADKLWGTDYANPCLYLYTNQLTNLVNGEIIPNSSLVLGSYKQKKNKKSIIADLDINGRNYIFDFSAFWKKNKSNYSCNEENGLLHIIISTENKNELMDLNIYCQKKNLLFVKRENVKGLLSHKKLGLCSSAYGNLKLFKKDKKSLELLEEISLEKCILEYGEN